MEDGEECDLGEVGPEEEDGEDEGGEESDRYQAGAKERPKLAVTKEVSQSLLEVSSGRGGRSCG